MTAAALRAPAPAAAPALPKVRLPDLCAACLSEAADQSTRGVTRQGWVLRQAGLFLDRLIDIYQKVLDWLRRAHPFTGDRSTKRAAAVPGAVGRTDEEPAPDLGEMALVCSDVGLVLEVSRFEAQSARGYVLRRAAKFLESLFPILPLIRAALAPKQRAAVPRAKE